MIPVLIILSHFVGDWFLQPRYMAMNKSKDLKVLGQHILIVGAVMAIPALVTLNFLGLLVYLVLHGIQDWYLWRYAHHFLDPDTPLSDQKVVYDFIALDQSIHLILAILLIG